MNDKPHIHIQTKRERKKKEEDSVLKEEKREMFDTASALPDLEEVLVLVVMVRLILQVKSALL